MVYKSKWRKLTAFAAACALLCSAAVPMVSWAGSKVQKEEVVYGNLAYDGTTQKVYVVNIFDENTSGSVSDYGEYTELRNMSSTDEIETKGDKIYVKTDEAPFYYEGVMDDAQLPWKVNISYRLDGARCEPEKLAGRSGELEINIDISENKLCNDVFYDNYALQVSLTLDGNYCRNIKAEDATIANVGSDRQITFTILPGKGADLKVTADVVDFEMDEITLNGVMLNMDVDVDDSELMKEADRLINGVEELDDGAGELADGTAELSSGASDVSKGASQVNQGSASLKSGASGVSKGASELDAAASELSSGSNEILKGIRDLMSGVSPDAYKNMMKMQGLDIEELEVGNSQAIQTLESQINAAPEEQAAQLKQIVTLLRGSNANIEGIERYLGEVNSKISELEKGTQALSEGAGKLSEGTAGLSKGASGLSAGADKLSEGTSELAEGAEALSEGADALDEGAGKLKEGTEEFRDETSDLDTKISDKIDEVKDSITGDSSKVTSFVSDKNTNVAKVQFALRTEAVKKADDGVQEQETSEEKGFLQKIMDLFR